MTAFFDAFRFSRKKQTQVDLSDESIPVDGYTGLIKGFPYESMSSNETQPAFGSPLHSFLTLDDSLPEMEYGLLQHLVEQRRSEKEFGLKDDPTEPPYVITGDYVTIARDPGSYLESTKLHAKTLKMKTELFYNNSVGFAAERNKRCNTSIFLFRYPTA